jgi:hypothetical protein
MADQTHEVAEPATLLDKKSLLNKTAIQLLISQYPLIKARLHARRAASALKDTPDATKNILDRLGLTGLPMDGVCSSFVINRVWGTVRDPVLRRPLFKVLFFSLHGMHSR